MDRVVVFMDYQNVHGWARRCFLPFGAAAADGHVFPLAVGELLAERRRRESDLMEVRVYGTQSPWCHHLNEADFESVRDRYDYSA